MQVRKDKKQRYTKHTSDKTFPTISTTVNFLDEVNNHSFSALVIYYVTFLTRFFGRFSTLIKEEYSVVTEVT